VRSPSPRGENSARAGDDTALKGPAFLEGEPLDIPAPYVRVRDGLGLSFGEPRPFADAIDFVLLLFLGLILVGPAEGDSAGERVHDKVELQIDATEILVYKRIAMALRLYVGNLNFDTTEAALRDAFAPFGQVTSVKIVTDRDTGRSRGFGFVEFSKPEEGKMAMNTMNGAEIDKRKLNVNEALPKESGGGSRSAGRGRASS
jgi:cold-inducible RNA-binding protein